ncbi:RNA recognition motif domain-containing protein [Maribellus sediminis]|uniref:RNA recognition motif domain-containing protein n=1 Tax=Maribellus sediminis TaxID=2696285 RepID=UPI00143168B1|nr:RNA-binding protein [Maribellus sediminis]
MNIYVSNLSYNTTSTSLEELFAAYGEVSSAKVITDKYTGDSRGFGFVEMADAAGKEAIEALNETEFEGKTLNVNVARPRVERNDGGRDNRGGGGFNRRRY